MKNKGSPSMRVKELKEALNNFDPEARVTLTMEGVPYPLWDVTKYNEDCDLGGGWSPLGEND